MVEEGPVATSGVALVRNRGASREVLISRRPHDRAFLGGFHGFVVGGRRSADQAVPLRPDGRFLAPERAAWGCAVRELFEETGILPLSAGTVVAWAAEQTVECPWESWSSFRARVDAEEVEFGEALRDAGLTVDVDSLHPVGEWPTPTWSKLQTRTEFFVFAPDFASASEGDLEAVAEHLDPREHERAGWFTPAEALRRWRNGRWFVSTPIRLVLEGLRQGRPVESEELLPSPSQRSRPLREMVEVTGGIRMLPLATPTLPPATHTNCYIVGEGPCLLIDPGSAISRETALLKETLDGLVRSGISPRAVVLTHHHDDHVAGVDAVRQSHDVEVWTHAETAERLDHIEVDRLLGDGDRIDLGPRHRLEVHHTPGHAPGHLALHHARTGSLFAGDLVAGVGTILIDPPEGEMAAYLESLERVDRLDLRALLPAHGPIVRRPHALLANYLEHRREREKKVLDALRAAAHPVRPSDLLPDAYDDTPRSAWPLAVRSLHAHLLHLVERGEARRRDDHFVPRGN